MSAYWSRSDDTRRADDAHDLFYLAHALADPMSRPLDRIGESLLGIAVRVLIESGADTSAVTGRVLDRIAAEKRGEYDALVTALLRTFEAPRPANNVEMR